MKRGPLIAISSVFLAIFSTIWYSSHQSNKKEAVPVVPIENPQLNHEDINFGK